MTILVIIFRYIALFATVCLLSGCLGGTIAQQIVRSIATKVADKAIASAMDVQDGPSNRKTTNAYASNFNNDTSAYKNTALAKQPTPETGPDPYKVAFVNAAFEPVQPIAEALPEETQEVETRINVMQGNQLVRVELFNLLIGEEKNAVYEQARLLGAAGLPQKREWQSWSVGTGTIKNEKDKKIITFLIPPEFGKLPSGATAVVELASPGELNVARYKAN